ncbi:MAG: RtcB family protein, partial [Myxococcales bacterium]
AATGAERLDLLYDVSHNLAKLEWHDVGGERRLLCVHRKGATRALPPGHSDLPDDLRLAGQPVLGAKTCDAPIACSAPADCPAEAVLCEANRCVQCRADRDCPREQTCFLGWCASPFDGACAASADCFHKFCDTGSGRCAQCVRSRECPATAYCSGSVCAPYPAANCDPFLQTGCGSGKSCTRAPDSRAMSICAETGTGAALASCARAEDCGPRLACTSGICAPLCDAAHPCSRGDCIIFNGLGTCTVCRDDPDCPSGTRCDPQTSTCYECLSDAQCSGATPRCDPIRRRCAQRETPDAGCADADCGAEADAGTPPGVDDEVPPVEAPSGCGCGSGGSAPAGLALLAWWALAPRRVRRSSAPRITRRDTARAA